MTLHRTYPAICLVSILLIAPLAAQEAGPSAEEAAMMAAMQKAMTPGSQHAYLAKQVGTYTATVKIWGDPSAAPEVSTGTATRTMILGGRVLHEAFQSSVMGMAFEGVGHNGYDNVTGRYWSTWSDSMSTNVAVLEGTVDTSTDKATFEGETSDPTAGKKVPMRIESSRKGSQKISEFYFPGPGGKLVKTMEIVYERQ